MSSANSRRLIVSATERHRTLAGRDVRRHPNIENDCLHCVALSLLRPAGAADSTGLGTAARVPGQRWHNLRTPAHSGVRGHCRQEFVASMKTINSIAVLAWLVCPAAAFGQDQSLGATLDVYVFPAEGQDSSQQSKDEAACYEWAVSNSGSDPFDLSTQQAASEQQAAQEQQAASSAGQGAGACQHCAKGPVQIRRQILVHHGPAQRIRTEEVLSGRADGWV